MIKVLYVINSLRVGGAENSVRNLVLEFQASQPRVSADVVVLYESGRIGAELETHGITVECLGAPRVPTLTHGRRLKQLVDRGNYDLIHTHLFPANYLVSLLARYDRQPGPVLIHTEHNVWNRRRRFWFGRAVERVMYRPFSCIIGVSAAVCASLGDWLPDTRGRIRLIPNGVCVPPARPVSPNEPPRLLFVGSLRSPVKGLDILLHALANRPQLTAGLMVVGDGPLRAELEALTQRLGLGQRVQFLGLRSDVTALMQQADLLVLPSRWEGLSLAVLESMAAGCPVVATAVGGVPELIEDGVTGWLAPPENPAALAERIQTALADLPGRRRVAQAAHAQVQEHYSIEQMARRTVQCYQEVLGQHGRNEQRV